MTLSKTISIQQKPLALQCWCFVVLYFSLPHCACTLPCVLRCTTLYTQQSTVVFCTFVGASCNLKSSISVVQRGMKRNISHCCSMQYDAIHLYTVQWSSVQFIIQYTVQCCTVVHCSGSKNPALQSKQLNARRCRFLQKMPRKCLGQNTVSCPARGKG